jgi:hypothetical protein
MLASINGVAARNPLLAAMFIGAAKNVGVDLTVQLSTNDVQFDQIDWRRTGCFFAFGSIWVGAAQFALFNRVLPRLLPRLDTPQRTRADALWAGFGDWGFHMPFAYLPVFYSMRALAFEREKSPIEAVSKGLADYRKNFVSDATTSAMIFGPVQTANFMFSPPHLRVPVVVFAGLTWTTILSIRRGDATKDTQQLAEA